MKGTRQSNTRNQTASYIPQPAIFLSYSGSTSVSFKSVAVRIMKAYGGVKLHTHSSLISALDNVSSLLHASAIYPPAPTSV
jgi:hypothetical protein